VEFLLLLGKKKGELIIADLLVDAFISAVYSGHFDKFKCIEERNKKKPFIY
jgi:hypothetical protein